MDINRTYSLNWAIFVGIPFGIGMLLAGSESIKEYPKTIYACQERTGYVQFYGDTLVNYPTKNNPNDTYLAYGVLLSDTLYISEIGWHTDCYKTFFSNTSNIKKKVRLWFSEDDNHNYIRQFSANGDLIVKFRRPYTLSLFFFIPGFLSLFFSLSLLYERITGKELFRRTLYPQNKFQKKSGSLVK